MSQQDELISLLSEAKSTRRKIITQAAAGSLALAAGAILPGCGGTGNGASNTTTTGGGTGTTPTTYIPTPSSYVPSAPDILNFALNLEYLEAEYNLFGTTGSGLSAADTGNSNAKITGDVFPNSGPVAFSYYGALANEIASDELNHVRFLRQNLGSSAVARPAIDLVNSFNAAAKAAGIGSTFNPFASETNFILGAFIFEDVGVTAYHGGAGTLATTNYLTAAAGILGVEAYHAGAIREIIIELGSTAISTANKISALRAAADGTGGAGNETPLSATSGYVAENSQSIAYTRGYRQVLNIVYLEQKPGGFFPYGLNGNLK